MPENPPPAALPVPESTRAERLPLTIMFVDMVNSSHLGERLEPEALFLWCVDRLPYFVLPRYIEFRAELPRSPVGRVLKRELRAEGATPTTWDLETSGITYEKK